MEPYAPFYPCQLADGSTHVVDKRSGRVVRTFTSTSDTVERWALARKLADRMNREAWAARTVRNDLLRVFGALAILAAVIAVIAY